MQLTAYGKALPGCRGFVSAKTWRIMRLTTALLTICCLHVAARGKAQQVTYSANNEPLQKVFTAIEKQTGYVFFYDIPLVRQARPVSIELKNVPLDQALNAVLKDQPLTWTIEKKTIIISPKPTLPVPPAADTTVRPAGPQFLTGLVMETNGTPLSGASVTIRESGKSTLTDGRGAFRIQAPAARSKIIISYVGYTTREVTLSEGQRELLVPLTVAVDALDEEVVQAYGKTSQRLAVGNIVKVSGEEIQKQPVMNPLLALNGRVPGLLITPTSGYLSSPVKVELRGRNTINPDLISDPLYVIDGVPLTILDVNGSFNKSNYANGSTGFYQAGLFSYTGGQSPLFSINPSDIESISVLKDATATAIYGSRASNGVILITTKKGKPGKTKFDINLQQSVNTAPKHWDMLNTQQYLQMRREAMKNDGYPLTVAFMPELAWDTTRYTDWQKELLGIAKSTSANIRLSGGERNTTFTIGAGYNRSQDITTLSGKNERINVSSGITHRSADQKLSVDLSAGYSYTYVNAISIPSLITLSPNAPPIFDAKGNLNYAEWNAAGLGSNFPFSGVLVPSGNSTHFLNASLRLGYNLAKGLNVSVNGGYSNGQSNSTWFNPIAAQNPLFNPVGYAGFGNTAINNWNVDPRLNYSLYIGRGKLECMAGGSYQSTFAKTTTMSGSGYTNDALLQSIVGAASVGSGQQLAQKKYASMYGRINYNWRNKYILELNGNRDGSSNFGPGRQFGHFWSVGSAWIASEEAWAKRLLPSWWSYLKLNASYGITGDDNGLAYGYLSQWANTRDYSGIPLLYNGVVPMTAQRAVNPDYQWQETRKINADLSMGFLKDRITLTVTWYNHRCNNQLTSLPTPLYTGFASVQGNSPANVENTGWEGSIHAQLVKSKAFSWTMGFNIGINKNKLISYPNFELSPYYSTKKIGKSLNTIYLLHYIGVNPLNGRRSYEDYNHDGLVTQNSGVPAGTSNDDRYIAFDPTAKYFGGFSNQFSYKQFMLSTFCYFKKQRGQMPYTGTGGAMGNMPLDVFNNRWQQPGDQVIYPRLTTLGTTSDFQFGQSDGVYTDNSMIRMSTLEFSYSLPGAFCKKMHMQGASFSVNMSNVFTITGYKGLDPDVTFGNLPQPRVIAGRISFTF